MEEFVKLPSDGRLINKRYIHDFDPKRQSRLNYSSGSYVLLKDPRDVQAVIDALTPPVQRKPGEIKAEPKPGARKRGRPRKDSSVTK
jgi:hypothetical protein